MGTPTEVIYAQAVSQLNEQYQVTVIAYEQIIQATKQEDDGSVRRIQELEGYWHTAQQQVMEILGQYNQLYMEYGRLTEEHRTVMAAHGVIRRV